MTPDETHLAGIERRVYTRHSCHWPASCHYDGGKTAAVIISDASAGGFCVQASFAVEPGQLVSLDLKEIGTFDCLVRWTAADRFGVQILEPPHELSSSEIDGLAHTLSLAVS